MNDHMTRIQFELTRVADALERIAIILVGDQVENIITVSPGPFVWSEAVQEFVKAEEAQESARGRRPGRPSHCGRCGREGTRRLNHADHCKQCKQEAWWDE